MEAGWIKHFWVKRATRTKVQIQGRRMQSCVGFVGNGVCSLGGRSIGTAVERLIPRMKAWAWCVSRSHPQLFKGITSSVIQREGWLWLLAMQTSTEWFICLNSSGERSFDGSVKHRRTLICSSSVGMMPVVLWRAKARGSHGVRPGFRLALVPLPVLFCLSFAFLEYLQCRATVCTY